MKEIIDIVLIVVGTIIIGGLLMTLPTMFLWDWLMPKIFGLPEITFWEALGINLLCSILFKSSSSSKS